MGHVFGPVPSRRLGRSLGIDLVPLKTCTYDCVYCQIGCTTSKTTERKEWVPLDEVVEELQGKLSSHPDYITLSGSGEPLLYSRLDELIERIHSLTEIPVAVITNGSLLWDAGVRRQLAHADLVAPSLDAGSSEVFQVVNRPHPRISLQLVLEGLAAFREEFSGAYWLEVLVLAGYSAAPAEARRIAAHAGAIRPDRVQLNTVTRPPAEESAMAVDQVRLAEIADYFDPPAEIIADFRATHSLPEFTSTRAAVLDMLARRPCSLEDLVGGLGIHRHQALKFVEELSREGAIEQRVTNGRVYFSQR
jgi:wyosine [tRNA(Phe)-imidazoG37] synthetase (radical SAM superfamily)